MNFVEDLLKKAKAANKTIVLCEGEDKRVVGHYEGASGGRYT